MGHGEYNITLPETNAENVTIKCGNILNADTQTVVNTVNCVGVMGKGLAAEFSKKYPDMYAAYKQLCDAGKIKIGTLHLYRIPNSDRCILNFPTKDHWRFGSKIEYLVAGLRKFVDTYKKAGITSIAFPMLGCRNGGLKQSDVFPLMCGFFQQVDIPVEIWFYVEEPEEKVESFELF